MSHSHAEHFAASQWVDYTRNLLPAVNRAPMNGHLDEGCQECQKAYETWGLVLDWTSREKLYRPPEDVVRSAKSAFVPEKTSHWLRQIAQFAAMSFDSFRQPATAGIRSAAQASRQVIHEAEPFTIDLKLEADAAQKQVQLAGQILDADNPERVFEGVEVVLLRGAELVTRTPANPAGEFQMRFKAEGELQLFINIRGERAIGIDLPMETGWRGR